MVFEMQNDQLTVRVEDLEQARQNVYKRMRHTRRLDLLKEDQLVHLKVLVHVNLVEVSVLKVLDDLTKIDLQHLTQTLVALTCELKYLQQQRVRWACLLYEKLD